MGIRGPMDLEVWKKAMALDEEIGLLISRLPKKEWNNLIDQMGRCATSVGSNISEGYGRKSTKDYVQFLSIAHGSNFEVQAQLEICVRRGYFTEREIQKAMNLSISVHKKLSRMIESLERKIEEEERRKKEEKKKRAKP